MLLLVAAIWGSSYAVTKQATAQMPVIAFLTLRFGLTFVVLLPALRPLFGAEWRRGLWVGGRLGANLLAIFLCETFGVTLTTAANAAFLISLCVAITPMTEWWLLSHRPSARVFWAAGLSVLGAALLSVSSPWQQVGWGDGLMLMAAVLRALMITQTKRLAPRHTLPALTLTAVQAGVVTLGLCVLMLVVHGTHWPALPRQAGFWTEMCFLVVLCTVFAFFAQNYAATRTSPSRVSLLMGSEPVFGALFAMFWLGERVSLFGWIGGMLIVVSAWWVTKAAAVLKQED